MCVPYNQASPQQISQALVYVMQELSQHFPTLGFVPWTNAVLQLKPDLWLRGDAVYLDEDDLSYLAQRLAASRSLPDLDPALYPDRACYLAKRLVNYRDEALEALADIEANPLAYGGRVFELVTGLALGNSVADTVFRVTYRGPKGRPGSPDPAPARASVHAQVRALRHARGEVYLQAMAELPADPTN
jgi:hypothetical protein